MNPDKINADLPPEWEESEYRIRDLLEKQRAANRLAELRDQFAMAALTGLCTKAVIAYENVAGHAYGIADAMLKAREPQGDANE